MHTIVFSYNRPAQLDLTLRSIEENHPIQQEVSVLYRSDPEFEAGYEKLLDLHPNVIFFRENDFRKNLIDLIEFDKGDLTSFFTDDDVVYRRPDFTENSIKELHNLNILALSLRLGRNTYIQTPETNERCQFPNFVKYAGFLIWDYKSVRGNFSYPLSVDGTIFKTATILDLAKQISFKNPNTFEAHLYNLLPLPGYMACSDVSCVVGVPVNRVQDEFQNPAGVTHYQDPIALNSLFLSGHRLRFPKTQVIGAHQEVKYELESP